MAELADALDLGSSPNRVQVQILLSAPNYQLQQLRGIMEKYIVKINDKLLQEEGIERARKVKKIYQTIGGILLAAGLAGFVALFIAFMILFLKFKTDDAFTCWLIAIPFLIMLIPGSVLARIGDALLPEERKNKKKFKKYKSEVLAEKLSKDLKGKEDSQPAEEKQ